MTRDIKQRMESLQTGNAVALNLELLIKCRSDAHARYIEQTAHRMFKKYRCVGEWFMYSKKIRTFVQDAIKQLAAKEAAIEKNRQLDREFMDVVSQ